MDKLEVCRKKFKEFSAKQDKDGNIIPSRRRSEDRITNLPSSLITKILSYLPTENAVRTSILSTKWKWMWTSVTNLDFYDHYEYRDCNAEDFTSFVNRVLLLHDKSPLQRFRMKCCSYRYKESLINAWIASILPCNVQELNLSLQMVQPSRLLPSDIFISKTLVVLKIKRAGHVYIPNSVCLPRLKTLKISGSEISNDVAFSSLMSGCPVLENLSLHHCICNDLHVINIIAPALINLTIEELLDMEDFDHKYEIVLDTPALQYLNFGDYGAEGYVVKNLDHLMKAEIAIGVPDEEEDDQFTQNRLKAVRNFLKGISQVRSLVLSYETTLAIHLCDTALPIFSNLTDLELETAYCELRILPKLLESSPCLETLTFAMKYFPDVNYFSMDDLPSCFSFHLKVVKIFYFQGLEHDMHVAEYFLKNAKVLEKLTIEFRPRGSAADDIREISNVYKQLLLLPRGSAICKVEVI